MRKLFILLSLVALGLSSNKSFGQISISSFYVGYQYLDDGKVMYNPESATPISSNFSISRSGTTYNSAMVLLLFVSNGWEQTIGSRLITSFNNNFASGIINGSIPSGSQPGVIKIRVTMMNGTQTGPSVESSLQYQMIAALTKKNIYQFQHTSTGRYSLNRNPDWFYNNTGWQQAGQPFRAYSSAQASSVGIYDFVNTTTNDHIYTLSSSGVSGYTYVALSFYGYATQESGTVPIYEHYNASTATHLYTPSYTPASGFVNSGIAFYAFAN